MGNPLLTRGVFVEVEFMAYNLFASTTALGDLLHLFRHFMVGVLYVLSEIVHLGNLNLALNMAF